jgi:integrase
MKLKDSLPTPTNESPYTQVDYIFETVGNLKYSDSTKENYKQALSFYKKLLNETNNYDSRLEEDSRFYLHKYWDEFALLKVEMFISETNKKGAEGYLTSMTVNGYFSAIRQVFQYAFHHKLCATDEFFNAFVVEGERETEIRESYSEREYEEVMNIVRQELDYTLRFLSGKGYRKTGVGRDPRVVPRKGIKRGEKVDGYGWKELDNVRWYFENEMNFLALAGTPENKAKHKTFFTNATNKFKEIGGINGIYKKWGVASLITAEMIMPLAVKLISETGLNPESLWDLEVDCFQQSHPLSGVPFIKYFKRRSGGEKVMHVSISGENLETKEFREHQAKVVEKTINQILKLTSSIRENAPEQMKKKLFLYQTNSNKKFGTYRVINSRISSDWCSKMVEKYDLKSDSGEKLIFNFARFRPTRITKLVELGVDFFEIQHEAGHQNILTTLRYLSRNRLNKKAKEETNKALIQISENMVWAEKEKPVYATQDQQKQSNILYKGIMSDCKNPYDPPKDVKNLKDYQDGQACTRFNMCLLCQNVVLLKHHLPIIVSYKKQIEIAMNNPNGEIPNMFLYQQSLDVINSILDPEKSEFDETDIRLAFEAAETMDVIIDPVIYKPLYEK